MFADTGLNYAWHGQVLSETLDQVASSPVPPDGGGGRGRNCLVDTT